MTEPSRIDSQYIYVLRPVRIGMVTEGPTEVERALVGRHFAHLEALVAQGVVLLVGRTQANDPRTFGIVIYLAKDAEAAAAIANADPAVAGGIMTAEVHPFRIALAGKLGTVPN